MNIRAHAATVLAPILQGEQSLQTTFDSQIERIPDRDRALFHELCYGCLRHYEYLDAIANALLNKPLKAKDSDIYALILLGLYQIHFLRIPDHAALSETVNAAKVIRKLWAKGFINGVLRNYIRNKIQLDTAALKQPEAEHRLPGWLLNRIRVDWPDYWQSIADASHAQAPIYVRINTRRVSLNEARAELDAHNCEPIETRLNKSSLMLKRATNIAQLPGFAAGWLSVQDDAAQLAADLLKTSPGMRVLDACAAPGGKSCHILEREPELEYLHAVELSAERAAKIHTNLSRLRLEAEVIVGDASAPNTWWNGEAYDRILLDAPCSATGVIRRHPDIKLLRRESDLDKLAKTQMALLQTLWPLLKPGGQLLYVTCSILKAENERVVAAFLASHKDAEHEQIDAEWGAKRSIGRQLFPQLGGHDGFYYARLRKTALS